LAKKKKNPFLIPGFFCQGCESSDEFAKDNAKFHHSSVDHCDAWTSASLDLLMASGLSEAFPSLGQLRGKLLAYLQGHRRTKMLALSGPAKASLRVWCCRKTPP